MTRCLNCGAERFNDTCDGCGLNSSAAEFFLTLGLGMIVERRALRHMEVEALKRIYYGLIPLPWLLAILLFGNGALDRSPPHVEKARVIGKFSMPGPVPNRRLVVTSWREGRRFERVP